MADSLIEWTQKTWNPVRGCAAVSAGCTHCYAQRVAHRFDGPGLPYEGLTHMTSAGPKWTGAVRLVPELLEAPLRWKQPRRIFINSMSDLFHPDVPDEFIDRVFEVAGSCDDRDQGHVFQVLTKRPERMMQYVVTRAHRAWNAKRLATESFPMRNVWLGVSCEDQKTADERIPYLLATPAAVRWISAEPLLGTIDLYWAAGYDDQGDTPSVHQLDWVVCGGESGPQSRPMHPDWARSIRDQCAAAGLPFFYKQAGDFRPGNDMDQVFHGKPIVLDAGNGRSSVKMFRVGKKAAGRLLDGRTWDEYPEARR